jgi:hypothetical protein
MVLSILNTFIEEGINFMKKSEFDNISENLKVIGDGVTKLSKSFISRMKLNLIVIKYKTAKFFKAEANKKYTKDNILDDTPEKSKQTGEICK